MKLNEFKEEIFKKRPDAKEAYEKFNADYYRKRFEFIKEKWGIHSKQMKEFIDYLPIDKVLEGKFIKSVKDHTAVLLDKLNREVYHSDGYILIPDKQEDALAMMERVLGRDGVLDSICGNYEDPIYNGIITALDRVISVCQDNGYMVVITKKPNTAEATTSEGEKEC